MCGLPSQSGPDDAELRAASWLISPFCWYMNSHSIETTTIEVTTGRKYTVRKKLTPVDLDVDQQRQHQAQAGLHRHDEDGEEDGVAQRLPEHRVAEQPGEVVDADELRPAAGR